MAHGSSRAYACAIGWSMSSSTAIVDDQGYVFDLLHLPPKAVIEFARQGVERWQARQILAHHRDMCYGRA
eukprot:1713387-Pyramimonas_sp.AAC.1